MPVVSSICISGVRAMALAAVPTLTGPSTTPSNAKTQKRRSATTTNMNLCLHSAALIGRRSRKVATDRRTDALADWQPRGETVIDQDLLVIRTYRMEFEIEPDGAAPRQRVFIDYDYPGTLAGKLLGSLVGSLYARWCVRRMARDARRRFL